MPDLTAAVTDLNAGWYNVVADAMKLDKTKFQLAQGTLGLQSSDSSGLFLMADAEPAPSAVGYYDAGLSRRSSAYNLLLHALKGEGGSDLVNVLGDQYANWVAYRNADTSDLTQQQLFEKWANRRLDPGAAQKAITVFKQQATLPLNMALDAYANTANQQTFVDDSGKSYQLYGYAPTIANAVAAIAGSSGSATIDFSSSSMDTSIDSTWVKGAASGFYDIFSADANASFSQLASKAVGSEITIDGKIGAFTTMLVQPGAWFTSGEFTRAYNGQNNLNVWDPNSSAGGWNSFFDPAVGSLARRVSSLVLVSDYSLTVTSHASYDESDMQQIEAAASFGVWPFFSASASSSVSQSHTLNQDGSLSTTYSLPEGAIQVWGMIVEAAPN